MLHGLLLKVLILFLQAYSNWELLIVDDCSMDNSVRIAQKFVDIDKRVRLFPLEKNVGAAVLCPECCYRTGKRAIYRFLDSDDVWEEDKLEEAAGFYGRKFLRFYIF